MNEQIREIARQAGVLTDWGEDIKVGRYSIGGNYQNMQRFAELLIEKCIKAASDPGDGLIKGNTWHDGVRACVWSIQQEFNLDRSFGVEP